MAIVFDHAVAVFILAGLAEACFLQMGAEVHACGVPPAEKGLTILVFSANKFFGAGEGFLVDGFHALFGEWAGVFDGLATFAIGLAFENSAWAVGF